MTYTDPTPAVPEPAPGSDMDTAVRGVQAWMSLDLHMALARPVNHHPDAPHQDHGSWSEWWADLLAEVREMTPPAESDTAPWPDRLAQAGHDPDRLLALAYLATRRLSSALIASSHLLDQPFTDAPDQSPWTRSIAPALRAVHQAQHALNQAPDPSVQSTFITIDTTAFERALGSSRPALRRAIDRALTAPVPCPGCERTGPCRCADASRHEGRVDVLLAAVTPWLKDEAHGH